MLEAQTVSTIAEFIAWVENVAEQFTKNGEICKPWFRGTGDSTYPLIPSLYRTDEGRDKRSDHELRREFARRALPLLADRAPRDEWEWYSLMQHYRAPTRLLDWTDAALVALYFGLTAHQVIRQSWALGRTDPPLPKPAVWALNPWTLNAHHGIYGSAGLEERHRIAAYLPPLFNFEVEIPQYPVAVSPTLTAQRMLVQHSQFTLHGRDVRSLSDMAGELGLEHDLLQVIIDIKDEDDGDRLKETITLLGITATTVFPDLEGLASELRSEYSVGPE